MSDKKVEEKYQTDRANVEYKGKAVCADESYTECLLRYVWKRLQFGKGMIWNVSINMKYFPTLDYNVTDCVLRIVPRFHIEYNNKIRRT